VWGNFSKDVLEKLPADIIEGSKTTFLRKDNLTALLLAGGSGDVVFGVILGWVVGHTVAGSHKKA
jgi:hypothetical protein